MNKELEALKQVNELIKNVEEYKNKTGKDNPTICLSEKLLISIQNALQSALQRLEAIDNANPSEALECLEEIGTTLMFTANEEGLETKPLKEVMPNYFSTVNQALIKFERLDWLLTLPSEQTSSHFTYKDKNLVCMQLAKYSKLMNAFLEYEKAQEQEKDFLKREMQLLYDKNFLKEENTELKRVLEIIKEKSVEMALFNDSKTVEDYNRNRNWGAKELTQEEFDLLKRYLNDN